MRNMLEDHILALLFLQKKRHLSLCQHKDSNRFSCKWSFFDNDFMPASRGKPVINIQRQGWMENQVVNTWTWPPDHQRFACSHPWGTQARSSVSFFTTTPRDAFREKYTWGIFLATVYPRGKQTLNSTSSSSICLFSLQPSFFIFNASVINRALILHPLFSFLQPPVCVSVCHFFGAVTRGVYHTERIKHTPSGSNTKRAKSSHATDWQKQAILPKKTEWLAP